jgi:hypothetical protein
METNIEKLRCGGCGGDVHKLYKRKNGEIIAECVHCNSKTEFIVQNPKIEMHHNSGDGTLCVFPKDQNIHS